MESLGKDIRNIWNGLGTTGSYRFHEKKGQNLRFNRNRTSARRISGFSHGLCFSHCPILPGQVFLVEITDSQDGWSGHLRVGVTQCNPTEFDTVPEMAIPDMTDSTTSTGTHQYGYSRLAKPTFAVAITKFHNRIRSKYKEIRAENQEDTFSNRIASFSNQKILLEKLYFFGRRELSFNSSGVRFPEFGQSTFTGSRIGIVIVPCDETDSETYDLGDTITSTSVCRKCNMHVVINGEDQGPSVRGISLKHPLYALVDIYSTTTRVTLVDTSHLGSLKDLCRDVIRTRLPLNELCEELPLPTTLIQFCQYQ